MSVKDTVIPFIFESLPVRGAIVQLENSWQRLQRSHNYPNPVAEILGHAAAATLLIAQSLKFEGTVTLQTNSDGPLGLLVMQSTHELDFRGMATSSGVTENSSYADLLGGARCAVTVDAGAMEQPYQGIVEMSSQSLGASLENYFVRSVQLPSHLQLRGNKNCSGGILLQQMPEKTSITEDDWRRLGLLIETLKVDELEVGATPELLHKLFAEDDVRVFQSRSTRFQCRCSKAKVEDVLRFLGEAETRSACVEKGIVEVTCEFCGRIRSFDAVDVTRVFAEMPVDGSDTVH